MSMSVLGFNAALEKQPSEQLTVKANFSDVATGLVVSGYALNECNVTVFDQSGANQNNNMIQGSPTLDGNNNCVFVCFKAGNDGENYFAQFKLTWTKSTQPDQKIERDLLIQVRQKGF
jgi:hypothetical protein